MPHLRRILALAILSLPLAGFFTPETHAGQVTSDAEWKVLYKKLKKDLYRARGKTPKEERELVKNRRVAVRLIGEANWPGAAEALIEFISKPNPRLIPLEKRKRELVKEINYFLKRARSQGGGLAPEDAVKVRKAQAALRKLNRTLGKENEVSRLAIHVMGLFNHPDAMNLIMEEALNHKSWRVRLGLLEALGTLQSEKAVKVLKDALKEEDPGIRTVAMESLANRGPAAGFESALAALKDEFWQVRATAIKALGYFGEVKAVDPLIQALKTEVGRLKEDIAEALRNLTGKTLDPDYQLWASWWESGNHKTETQKVCNIRKGLRSLESAERAKAVVGMAKLGAKMGYPVALKAFTDKEDVVRTAALDAFEIIRDLRIVDVLIKALEDEEDPLRKRIEQCLIVLTACTEDMETDPDMWRGWWKRNEKKVREAAPPPSTGPKEQKAAATGTTFYGIPTESTNVMFVIDVSGSMNARVPLPDGVHLAPKGERDQPGSGPKVATRLGLANWELKKAIAGLSVESRFNIAYYSDGVNFFTKGKMLLATKTGKTSAYHFIDKLMAVGGTNIHDALVQAFTLADPKNEKKNLKVGIDTIYFLSDGMPSVGDVVEPERILEIIRDKNRIRKITIHTICLLSKQGADIPQEDPKKMADFMRRLAEENGGKSVVH
ncbi:MAG: HEAT repeat domain-containing protein [Planctomycetota bacterium]|jgi:HEAT repeat protein